MIYDLPGSKSLPPEVVIGDIVFMNDYIHDFWQNGAPGWSRAETAYLLRRSRLDRQVSLSRCLRLWVEVPPASEIGGRLILGWTNLGSLIEGSMTWFLCVWAHAYAKTPMKGRRSGIDLAPDALNFDELCRFFAQEVWVDGEREEWQDWCNQVRQRRNAIHAYRDRDIGTWPELQAAIRKYREFLHELNSCIPYPDEHPQVDLRHVDLLRARRGNIEA
jgi:hypothetical protein